MSGHLSFRHNITYRWYNTTTILLLLLLQLQPAMLCAFLLLLLYCNSDSFYFCWYRVKATSNSALLWLCCSRYFYIYQSCYFQSCIFFYLSSCSSYYREHDHGQFQSLLHESCVSSAPCRALYIVHQSFLQSVSYPTSVTLFSHNYILTPLRLLSFSSLFSIFSVSPLFPKVFWLVVQRLKAAQHQHWSSYSGVQLKCTAAWICGQDQHRRPFLFADSNNSMKKVNITHPHLPLTGPLKKKVFRACGAFKSGFKKNKMLWDPKLHRDGPMTAWQTVPL